MKRILIVKLSSLGDLFHALPAVHELRNKLPAELHWVVQQEYAELVTCFTDVSRVIAFPRRNFFGRLRSFLRELRHERYDMVVDLQGLLKSALVARMARGGVRIGPSFHRECSRLFYSSVPRSDGRRRHAVEQCLDTVRHLGIEPGTPAFPVEFPVNQLSEPAPRVAVLPVSRWPTKNWPLDNFAEAMRIMLRHRHISFYLLGGDGDAEACRALARSVGSDKVINLAGRQSLPETGGMLKKMDLLIANDSGPVHMAAAVGTPALVVFGPTDPARTGPYGEAHEIITAPVECRPCFSRVCRDGQLLCMKSIAPDQVASAALKLLRSVVVL